MRTALHLSIRVGQSAVYHLASTRNSDQRCSCRFSDLFLHLNHRHMHEYSGRAA